FVPDHSDGVAAVSHRLPWALSSTLGANDAQTVAESPRARNARQRRVVEWARQREGRLMDRRDFLKASAAATLTLAADTTWAQNAKTEIHWLGQGTTKITPPRGKVIVIDPWLVNNPKTPADYKNLDKLGKVDVILVTHAHGDHVGTLGRSDGTSDTADLAKRPGAKVFGPAGLIQTMIDLGWVTGEQGVRFGKGGTVTPLGPQIKITQVRAEHSSELTLVDPTTKKSQTYPGGEPAGFIIEVEN